MIYGVVSGSETICLFALPCIAPSAIETTHSVAIGTSDKDLLALSYWEHAIIVLKQHDALLSALESSLSKCFATEIRIIGPLGVGLVKEAKTHLHAHHARSSVIDAIHAYLALIYEFFQEVAEISAIGIHGHVDSGIDSLADGIFLVGSHFLAFPQIVDVGPVGDDHAVPAQINLEPLGEKLGIGMHRGAVDTA